jgi:hypothetical protein
MTGVTYQRLDEYCAVLGVSKAGFSERLITEKMDEAGVPVPTRVEPTQPREPEPEPRPAPDPKKHFTF